MVDCLSKPAYLGRATRRQNLRLNRGYDDIIVVPVICAVVHHLQALEYCLEAQSQLRGGDG